MVTLVLGWGGITNLVLDYMLLEGLILGSRTATVVGDMGSYN